jgi:hypothetical protein
MTPTDGADFPALPSALARQRRRDARAFRAWALVVAGGLLVLGLALLAAWLMRPTRQPGAELPHVTIEVPGMH